MTLETGERLDTGGARPEAVPADVGRFATENRWVQLAVGVVAMVATANLQYGWTLFVKPIATKFAWSEAPIQVSFTIFIVTQTWLTPFEAWFVDRFGPKWVVAIGGILVGLSWVIDAAASSLSLLYLGGITGGIGAGIVYSTCMGNALKWFPDRRGLASSRYRPSPMSGRRGGISNGAKRSAPPRSGSSISCSPWSPQEG